jgi:hypothetical protein
MSLSVERIVNYYKYIANLTEQVGDIINLDNYNIIMKLYNNTSYNETTQTITTKLDDDDKHNIKIKLNLITKSFDWAKMFESLGKEFKKLVGLEEDKEFEYNVLHQNIVNIGLTNKIKYKIYANENNLVLDPENIYQGYGWTNYYDFLGLDISKYPKTLNEWKVLCKKLFHRKLDEKTYFKCCAKFNLPEMPNELYKDFTNIKDELLSLFGSIIKTRRANA